MRGETLEENRIVSPLLGRKKKSRFIVIFKKGTSAVYGFSGVQRYGEEFPGATEENEVREDETKRGKVCIIFFWQTVQFFPRCCREELQYLLF